MRTFTSLDYQEVKPIDRYLVVEVEPVEHKTAGGIMLPEMVKDAHKFSEVKGRVVSMGDFAFYKNVNGELVKGDVEVGDYILFHPYSGDLHENIEGKSDFRIIHDGAIVGRLKREGE